VPELPEVESVRLSLLPVLIGKRVRSARLFRDDYARDEDGRTPNARALLHGATIDRLTRHGKQLAVIARDGRALVVHLGMSGRVRHVTTAGAKDLPAHTHAAWKLDDGTAIQFIDPRRFGELRTVRDAERLGETLWRDLGPDALAIDARILRERARGSRRAIKSVLLDQHVLAGVGNIYADEALFRAAIRPTRLAARLTDDDFTRLAASVRRVLVRAIELRGSTINDYLDATGVAGNAQAEHMVYGRGGTPCTRCGTILISAQVAQRTTVWCPTCQA
jgi:formamidopyrimidine-DNA glycosylase